MRVVHAFRSPVGGIFRHVRDLARAQHAAGHDVGIVCDASTGGAHEDDLFGAIAPYLTLGAHRVVMQRHIGVGDVAAAARTLRAIGRLKPDILHGHGAKGGLYARVFGTLLRREGASPARLYSPHGGVLHYEARSVSGRFYFATERRLEAFTDHLLFVSDHERAAYRTKIGMPRTASSLVYNGVADAEFEPVPTSPHAADFLYIGMMRDLKGPDLFIEALAVLRAARGAVSAVMVGEGDDLPRYKARAAQLGLDIRFLPAMPARTAFGLGRTMVVPSRAEAMPYIVLEALAARRALIATAVGGIPEILGRDCAALAAPTVASLAAQMARALDEPAFPASAMPDACRLQQRFSIQAMTSNIENIYRECTRQAVHHPLARLS